jgi:phospholipase C
MHRRAFLRLIGAVLATAAFPPVVRKALAIPASSRHRSIMDVEHVVILMQENRAFDHYFGTLPGVRGYGDRITIPLPGGRSVWEQQEDDGTTVLPYHLDSATGNAQRVLGTPHFWGDAHAAWNKGATGQWPAYNVADVHRARRSRLGGLVAASSISVMARSSFQVMPVEPRSQRTHPKQTVLPARQ